MAAAAAPGPSMVDSLQSVRRARPGDGDDVWLVVGDSSDRQVRVNWDEDLVVSCAGGSEHFVLSRRAAVTMSAFLKDFTADGSGLGPGNAAVIPVDFSAAAIQNVVCFMEYHVDRRRTLCKPLWPNSAPANLETCLTGPELVVAEALLRQPDFLFELMRAADYLSVTSLHELGCAALAVAAARLNRSVLSAIDRLPVLSQLEILTYMTPKCITNVLASRKILREEVCFFAAKHWFADLRATEDPCSAPMPPARSRELIFPASCFVDLQETRSRDAVADARVVTAAGGYMRDAKFVPSAVTKEWLHDELSRLLRAVDEGSVVGIFNEGVVGPLGTWLKHALGHRKLTAWIVSDKDERHSRTRICNSSVLVCKPQKRVTQRKVTKSPPEHTRDDLKSMEEQSRQSTAAAELMDRPDPNVRIVALCIGTTDVILVGQLNGRCVWTQTRTHHGIRGERLAVANDSALYSKAFDGQFIRYVAPPSEADASRSGAVAITPALGRIDITEWRPIIHFFCVTALDLGGWCAPDIGSGFLENCVTLTSVTASSPCLVKQIHDNVFSGCTSLKTIDLSLCVHLKTIGNSFCENSGIDSLDLGGWAMTSVGACFFAQCTSLTSVTATAPCALRRMGSDAFAACALKKVDFTLCAGLCEAGSAYCNR